MDLVFIGDWAVKIAREVAPGEEFQARSIAHEFVRGGRDRKKLFKQIKGSEVGGSGLGEITIFFVHVLQALVVAGPTINKILTDRAITNSIDPLKETKELYENFKKKDPKKLDQGQMAQASTLSTPVSANISPSPDRVRATTPMAQIRQFQTLISEAHQSMVEVMSASGVTAKDLEDKSYRTLLVLFKEPEDAARFIKALREK